LLDDGRIPIQTNKITGRIREARKLMALNVPEHCLQYSGRKGYKKRRAGTGAQILQHSERADLLKEGEVVISKRYRKIQYRTIFTVKT
jgi:hypothetical protein